MATRPRTRPAAAPAAQPMLPLWANDVRGLPNAMARSALFNVAGHRAGKRELLKQKPIEALSGIAMTYTGEELRQDDEDVFLQLLHIGRSQDLGTVVRFTGYAMIKDLGWDNSSKGYNRLIECISRLKATSLELKVADPNGTDGVMGYGGGLIDKFHYRDIASGSPMREWEVLLDAKIVALFTPNSYSRLDWTTRLRLKPMAKWLHSFYHTHQTPFPMKVATFHSLMGSKAKQLRQFRASLKESLQELVDCGFLDSAARVASAEPAGLQGSGIGTRTSISAAFGAPGSWSADIERQPAKTLIDQTDRNSGHDNSGQRQLGVEIGH
jgi:hypothetical protein